MIRPTPADNAPMTPPVKFYSFRTDAPLPHPCDRYELHPEADPLCRPHIEALTMGLQMDSPLDWALTRTEDGMRVGWIRPDDSIDWQEPDEAGTVYHPEGPAIFDGFPVELADRARKIIVPGRGLQFANVRTSRPGLIEVISGMVFTPVTPGWGMRVGWPSGTPMPDGLAGVPHSFLRSWYQAPFPTVFEIAKIGDVVRFYRGDTMAALVPLPDAVMEGSRTDGRAVSGGVSEWPEELKRRVAIVSGQIYTRRGGYSAAVHKSDHAGGGCPFTGTAARSGPGLAERKRLLVDDLDDLGVDHVDESETLLICETPDRSRQMAALADAGIAVTYLPGHGLRIPVGTVGDNDRAACALAGGASYLHRAWRTRKTGFIPWPEPARAAPSG